MEGPLAPVRERKLSAREEQVLRQLAWGATHKDVATSLGLSVKTVETHKANAMRKLRLQTRQDVVVFAVKQGWFTLEPVTAIHTRTAALQDELAALKAVVAAGLADWSPGIPVRQDVNQAFRRVLEIGSALQEAIVVLDAAGDRERL
jgi:DNA-binding CsgD family transcriptional regulator